MCRFGFASLLFVLAAIIGVVRTRLATAAAARAAPGAALRGAISIALALVLPESPWRDLLLTIRFGVVIFTVVVQGVTLRAVVRRLFAAIVK